MNKEKYQKLILKNNLAGSFESVDLLVETLYQLAFMTVQKYLKERGSG